MIRIFEHTDEDGDELTVAESGHDLWFTVYGRSGVVLAATLTKDQVGVLRAALLPYDAMQQIAAVRESQAFQEGRDSAIDDHNLVTRELHDCHIQEAYERGIEDAKTELGNLDAQRVAALEKATEIAVQLRSTSLGGVGVITGEQVVGLALFLLGQVNMPAAQ